MHLMFFLNLKKPFSNHARGAGAVAAWPTHPTRSLLPACVAALAVLLTACQRGAHVEANAPTVQEAQTVGVIPVARKTLERQLTMSSELVPFQEIDVYAKESGYVRQLLVDYGSRVRRDQLMAVLEIPELEMVLQQDQASVRNMSDQVTHAEHELKRIEAQHRVRHLEYERLAAVAKEKPGLVAQQEVDDVQGRDLAAESQVEAAKAALEGAQSQLGIAKAKLQQDQVLFDYSRITAPFEGVVTQRYANLGTLMQAGTSSSTQALPLVRLSQDDKFRLVIPVPESYVRYIRIGDPVNVMVPSLQKSFPGRVARFSVDVKEETRTMHTEVDVPNPTRELISGLYAEATLSVERRDQALAVPLQAVDHQGQRITVLLVDPDGKLEARPLTLGIQTATDAEVLSGLKEGDLVVVSDRGGLKPGQLVKPQKVEAIEQSQS
ncbi:MAG TPA: efflux RND transporter periplasmic adaptor subunit [Bryobacteraceae bacterium]|nr:efflux RND transporter periplasmic adaptor subunit [Bryobacteraceae bacterium]